MAYNNFKTEVIKDLVDKIKNEKLKQKMKKFEEDTNTTKENKKKQKRDVKTKKEKKLESKSTNKKSKNNYIRVTMPTFL